MFLFPRKTKFEKINLYFFKYEIFSYSFFLLFVLELEYLSAQSMQAASLAGKAKRQVEDGDYTGAIKNYTEAIKLDKSNLDYQFALSMAHYRNEDYDACIDIGEGLLKDNYDPKLEYFRMLGNSYDLKGNYERCMEVMNLGLRFHPYRGELYLDLGIIEMLRDNTLKAMEYWETGIEKDPIFPDNYYWLSKHYAQSDEKLWAMLYGELFMNLEKGTERSDEISSICSICI